MQKILTISIAAYNVEEYLEQLLDSILGANRNDELEVLIINDGSKDNTISIAKKYAEKYPLMFIVIDKENGGHGSTINRGIQEATGKYFKIVDGDDWVESVGLTNLVDYLKNATEDLVLSDYRECYELDNSFKNMKETMKNTRKCIPLGEVVDFSNIAGKLERLQMHMITFKTDILKRNNIRVDEKCFYVDTEYVFFTLPFINTVSYIDELVYCYRLGRAGQSMTSESLRKNVENHVRVNIEIINKYSKYSGVASECVKSQMDTLCQDVTSLSYRIIMSMWPQKKHRDIIREIDMLLEQANPEVFNSINGSWLILLRKNRYRLFGVAWIMCRAKAVVEHFSKKERIHNDKNF